MRSQIIVIIQGIDGGKYDIAGRTATEAPHGRYEASNAIVRKYNVS